MNVVAILAALSFGLALGLLLTFFVTSDRRADIASGPAFLAFFAFAAAIVYEIHRRYVDQSAVVVVATVIGLATLAVLFVAQAAVAAGRVAFQRVAVVQMVGFAVYMLWVLLASGLVLAFGGLPATVGWIGVIAVAITLGVIGWFARDPALFRGTRDPSRSESALGLLPFIGIVAWFVSLGLSL